MSEPATLFGWVAHWAEAAPERIALQRRLADGTWESVSYREYHQRVRAFARGLIALGHRRGDLVSIVGGNRPEWVIAQLGIAAAAGIPAPIYPTCTKEQTAYIIRHTGAKIAICEDRALLDKHLACIAEDLVSLESVVTMDPVGSTDSRVTSFDAVSRLGREKEKELDLALDERIEATKPADTALLIFTSGTTGLPKGAELTHANIDAASRSVDETYPELRRFDYVCVSYLPLSHVAEQVFTNFMCLARGGTAYFCSDLSQVKDYLLAARPSIFLAVPRVWEKFEASMRSKLASAGRFKAKVAAWAMKTELDAFHRSVEEEADVRTLGRTLARKLVLDEVKKAIGFDHLVVAVSGAAPIAVSTLELFASLGVVIHECFGMTETSGVATAQPYQRPRLGNVGKPLIGIEVKIAADGEILLRGENLVRGYFKLPDETAELYDGEWLRTGDLGQIDEDGFLEITGRKKDLIITAGGKNVAPAEIEQLLSPLPGVGQVVVVGDGKPYLSALLALDPDSAGELARAAGSTADSLDEIAVCQQVRRFVQQHIDSTCNPSLARYQTVKKFAILPRPLSIEGGELTPTLKVKRNEVSKKYAATIETLYAGGTLNTPEAP